MNRMLWGGLLAVALLVLLAIGAAALWRSGRPLTTAPPARTPPPQEPDPSENLQRMYEELEAAAAANAQRTAEERNAMMNQSFDMFEAEADAILNRQE